MRESCPRSRRRGAEARERAWRDAGEFVTAAVRCGRRALDAVFPRGCAACGSLGWTLHGFLCLDCLAVIEACRPRETAVSEFGRTRLVCAAYRYVDAIRELVLRVKFGQERRLAGALGWRLSESVRADVDGLGVDAVIPVPLARRRLRTRGFNQAYEIARPVACVLGDRDGPLPILDRVLCRAAGGPQSRLGAIARQRNAVHAFRVDGRIDGMRILLVDDVLTTGSTLRACGRALHRAGAASIDAAVVAVSPSPGEASRDDR